MRLPGIYTQNALRDRRLVRSPTASGLDGAGGSFTGGWLHLDTMLVDRPSFPVSYEIPVEAQRACPGGVPMRIGRAGRSSVLVEQE